MSDRSDEEYVHSPADEYRPDAASEDDDPDPGRRTGDTAPGRADGTGDRAVGGYEHRPASEGSPEEPATGSVGDDGRQRSETPEPAGRDHSIPANGTDPRSRRGVDEDRQRGDGPPPAPEDAAGCTRWSGPGRSEAVRRSGDRPAGSEAARQSARHQRTAPGGATTEPTTPGRYRETGGSSGSAIDRTSRLLGLDIESVGRVLVVVGLVFLVTGIAIGLLPAVYGHHGTEAVATGEDVPDGPGMSEFERQAGQVVGLVFLYFPPVLAATVGLLAGVASRRARFDLYAGVAAGVAVGTVAYLLVVRLLTFYHPFHGGPAFYRERVSLDTHAVLGNALFMMVLTTPTAVACTACGDLLSGWLEGGAAPSLHRDVGEKGQRE